MKSLNDIDGTDVVDERDLEALLRSFATESEEQAQTIEDCLIAVEQGVGDEQSLPAVLRAVHTLKGNAASLGFRTLAAFAHTLEDLIVRLAADSSTVRADRIALLLRGVDAIRSLVARAVEGSLELEPDHRELIAALGETVALLPRGESKPLTTRKHDQPATMAGAPHGRSSRTMRVDVDKLDRLLDLAAEIAQARVRLGRIIDECDDEARGLTEAHDEATRLQHDLQELVMQIRVMPVGTAFRRFARVVRDLSAEHGKEATLETEGDDLEMDTAVLENLAAPLMHLVRNAIGHGIEPGDARQAAGKSRCGRITLRACEDDETMVISVSDDGAGLDRPRIIERAKALGLNDAHALSDRDLCRLVMEPSFSTTESPGTLAGRGVGMEIVRRHVDALGGSVEIDTVAGQGTTVMMRVPLTVATIGGVVVELANCLYLLPTESVRACMPGDSAESREEASLIVRGGRTIPHLSLGALLGAPTALADEVRAHRIVVVGDGGEEVALVVDCLVGDCRAVVRAGANAPRPGVAGAAILADGQVVLVINVVELLGEARRAGLV